MQRVYSLVLALSLSHSRSPEKIALHGQDRVKTDQWG